MAKKFGPMDIDYRVRAVAVVPEIRIDDYYMPEHQKIFYGCDAARIMGIQSVVFDVKANFKGLSSGGRHIGSHRETQKHFFNKRVFFDGETIQGRGDAASVRTPDGEGGTLSAYEIKAGEGSAGSGNQDTVNKDQGNEEGEVA